MRIQEVAEAAGVSIATVSRVFNHPELVSSETKERVLSVMHEQNAASKKTPPPPAVYAARKKRKNSIALVLPFANNYRKVFDGAIAIGNSRDYSVQLFMTGQDERALLRDVRTLISEEIDGVILSSEATTDTALEMLDEAHIPVVQIGGKSSKEILNLCYINYYESAVKLMEYAVSMGNRSLVLFLSTLESDCRESLRKAVFDYWAQEGLPADAIRVLEIGETCTDGYQYMGDIIQQGSLPDMIIGQYDELAVGAMKKAAESGISVPGQLRVLGFYNTPLSVMVSPELTTVEHPTYRLGRVAARRLLDIIDDADYFDVDSQEIVLKSRLKIRRSCGNQKPIYEMYE